MKTIYIIDGLSFVYRAFYAIGQLSTKQGQPTNAVYGFVRMLKKIIDKYNPQYLAMVFDTGKPTFRHEQFKEYKSHRKPMPDDLVLQIPWIKKVISAYNIPLIEMHGYEADDVIATMSIEAEKEKFSVYIVTDDKDMMQLVDPAIKIINPMKDDFVYDVERINERFGVGPDKITHILALTGDASDNIPGVAGVGEKTASKLIKQFGDIDGILNNIDSLSPKLKNAIQVHIDQIKENISLITLKKDLKIDITPEACIVKEPDYTELKNIFTELDFKGFLKELYEKDSSNLKDEINHDVCAIHTIADWDKTFKKLGKVKMLGITQDELAFEEDNKIKIIALNPISEMKSKIWNDVAKLLKNENVKKYGSDIKYFFKQGFEIKGIFFDVYIASSLLNQALIEEPHLSMHALKIAPELEKQLTNEGIFDLYSNIELPLAEVLASMENRGIKLDENILKKLSIELERDLEKLTGKIHKLAGEEFNINSPKQLEYILFEKLDLPSGRKTKTGHSTDVDVLEKLSKIHEFPKYVLEYRQLNKLKNTYIDPLPKLADAKTNRLHTTFNQVGTVTGRISSTNPNLQNIPIKTELGRKIRSAFVPKDSKFVLLGADYSQIELRILAHLSGDKILIDAFKNDLDVHALTAQEIFGVKEITPEMRRQAKTVNFGIIYGMGAKSLAGNLNISIQDAQKFIDTYMERYPSVGEYINYELNEAKQNGYVVTMFGRKRPVPELFSSKPQIQSFGQRIAINTPLQGSAADIIKMAMINIFRKIKEQNIMADMLLQIHDELIFELPESFAVEVGKFVKKEMENVVELKVPLKVDIKVGRSWADI